MARKKREQLEMSAAAEAESALVADSDAPAVASPAIEEPAPVEAAAPVVRWRVAASARVSLFGHLTSLPAGDVVGLNEYGPEGIARLREQGVVLEPMV